MRQTVEERFWAKVARTDDADGCWPWLGADKESYGRFWDGQRLRKATHVAFELQNGPIPSGLGVLHHCDNPPCMRGDHLFAGTQLQNIADRHAKGRSRGGSGYTPRPNQRRLDEPKVRRIRAAADLGLAHQKIARRQHVAMGTVYKIAKRITWRDL